VDRQAGHAAVSDAPERRELKPVHATVPDTHPLGIERLGYDHVALACAAEVGLVAQPRDAREAAALLISPSALLDAAVQTDAGATHRFDGVDRRGDARLLIARPATVDAPITQLGPKRVDRPAGLGRHHVVVAVEMQHRLVLASVTAAARPSPVEAASPVE